MNVHAADAGARTEPEFSDHLLELGAVPGLVWAFRIHDDGTADSLPVGEPIANRREGWLWLHLDLANVVATQWLTTSGLPRAAVATMLSRDRHQQLHTTSSYIHGVIADLECTMDGVTEDIHHLRFVMTDRVLISGRHRNLASVESARKALEAGQRRLSHIAALLELIVEQVADAIDRITDDLATELDGIESALAARSMDNERVKLLRVRRASVRLHRQLTGLRAVFHRLDRDGSELVRPSLRLAASKLSQRLDDLDHAVLELRERGHRLQDEMSTLMTEQTNRQLYILSMLTALLLPPTLVTGVFGMNVKGLPLTEDETGFLWAIALVVVSSLAVYLLMRKIGMLKL